MIRKRPSKKGTFYALSHLSSIYTDRRVDKTLFTDFFDNILNNSEKIDSR